MADERLFDPRPTALLRRHLLPSGGPPGMPSFRTVLTAMDDIGRTGGARSTPRPPSWPGRRPRSVVEQPGSHRPDESPSDLLTPAIEELARRFDPQWGGFGRAPKFPQPTLVDLLLYHSLRHRGPRPATGRAAWPRPPSTPWRRRHPRPPRRRVCPLCHRRPVAGAALREDALRPGRAGAGLPPRLAGHRAGRLPAGRRRHRGLRRTAT